MSKDPGETKDLAPEKPELLKRLQFKWEKYAEKAGVFLTEVIVPQRGTYITARGHIVKFRITE